MVVKYINYKSDCTQFLETLKKERPELAARQNEGFLLLRDKKIDRQLQRDFDDARLPQPPYVYQTGDL